MVPVALAPQIPLPAPTHLSSQPPLEGQDRARRTDGIVADLRLVPAETPGSRSLTDQLIETNAGVARSMAARYRNRGIDLDDLEQVALLGLTKAAQRFDPDAGHDFLSYAVPTIRGELRRHFRDSGWMVRPPRRVQELQSRISRAQRELETQLHRSPRPTEVAVHLGESLESVVEALTADGCFMPTSLDGPVGDGSSTLGDLLGHHDRALDSAEARIVLGPVVSRLTERDRLIVQLRFVEERTQQEIAESVGLTQAQVSRVLTRILGDLRSELLETSVA
ncbi:sigma-70 family RNA polymerase sigma factor [Nocardioides sp.]|uniref:sigma-70 family RNA polymerase sigma factor n=1 Tax=Nocardioides sp. TaxID=35761 RepID=UPI0026196331|nr:sigma-70 family RNA polymerase sigma factor [Nocardioides sp.]MCW2736296.1 hypothetical protein [Nocardioides sp.]